eukprot:TRINITY_DN35564_c0_g1_i1.p1 TRINITY_DN35564_c0_g1~~TRINITY_DN35564_c0_g1_i1.p1  ORF type:complete len:409 (+),score=124.06 TRINITY_DN35564_c0_g1_i1:108-1334(+)
MDDEAQPLTNLLMDSDLAIDIQNEVQRKLLADYSSAGTAETLNHVLPEYIKVLICNAKPKSRVKDDLELFLQDGAAAFVDWLWKLLADRNPKRSHSAFPEAPEEDVPRKKRKEPGARKRARGADAAKGFRGAIESATADAPADAKPRRMLRVRGSDPARAARLKSEWELMRQQEEQKRAKAKKKPRRPLVEEPMDEEEPPAAAAAVPETRFTITMDKLSPADVPSIAHYQEAEAAAAVGAAGLGLLQQMQAAWGGGKGWYGGGKGKGGYYGKGTVMYGGSPHMTMARTPADELQPLKKRLAVPSTAGVASPTAGGFGGGGPPAGSGFGAGGPPAAGGFGHLVWQAGGGAPEATKKESAAAVTSRTASQAGRHRVWVNPAVAKRKAEAAQAATAAAPAPADVKMDGTDV